MGKQSNKLSRRSRHTRSRTVSMTPDVADVLRMQQQLFKEIFGRDPGLGDPVFFDPDADAPQAFDSEILDQAVINSMVKSGMDPSYIYAY